MRHRALVTFASILILVASIHTALGAPASPEAAPLSRLAVADQEIVVGLKDVPLAKAIEVVTGGIGLTVRTEGTSDRRVSLGNGSKQTRRAVLEEIAASTGLAYEVPDPHSLVVRLPGTPRPVSAVEPEYTQQARARWAHGVARLHVAIGLDGAVQGTRSLGSDDPLLEQAVRDAVLQWRYAAQPAPTSIEVRVDFPQGLTRGVDRGPVGGMTQRLPPGWTVGGIEDALRMSPDHYLAAVLITEQEFGPCRRRIEQVLAAQGAPFAPGDVIAMPGNCGGQMRAAGFLVPFPPQPGSYGAKVWLVEPWPEDVANFREDLKKAGL